MDGEWESALARLAASLRDGLGLEADVAAAPGGELGGTLRWHVPRGQAGPTREHLAQSLGRLPRPAHLVALDDAEGFGTIALGLERRWGFVRLGPLGATRPRSASSRPGRAPAQGLVVAVYGVDGSGKSTVVQALVTAVGPLFSGVDRWHLFQRQVPGVTYVPVTDPHAREPWPTPVGEVKLALYLARAWLGRAPRVRTATRAGRLVVLDRDVADPWLDPRRYRLRPSSPSIALLPRLAPRPDLALVLDADAEEVRARSDEVEEARLESLIDRYRRFGQEYAPARIVDARPPAEEVAFAAAGAVFEVLERRIVGTAARKDSGPTDGSGRAGPWPEHAGHG